jgi:hydrogenase maturation protease
LKPTARCARSSGGFAEAAPPAARSLVLGLGNTLVSDDGFGPVVVEACRAAWAGERPEVEWLDAAVAGLRLLDLLAGYERALLLDVVQSGRFPPGTLLEWPLEASGQGRCLGGSHQCDLLAALGLGRALGVPMPSSLTLLVAEAGDLLTIREELTPPLAEAVPRAVALVEQWCDRRGPFAPDEGRDHAQARTLP